MPAARKTKVTKAKRKTGARKAASPDTNTRSVFGVMLIGLGLLMLFCLCIPSEASFIVGLRHVVQGLAGSVCLFLPVAVIWGGVLLLFSVRTRVRPKMMICATTLLLLLLIFLQTLQIEAIITKIDATPGMNRDYPTFLQLSYDNSSIMRRGGGVIGALIAWPLWHMLDVWGSILVLVFLFIADVLILTDVSFARVSEYFEDYFVHTREEFEARREERRLEKERRAQEKAYADTYDDEYDPAYDDEIEEMPEEAFFEEAPVAPVAPTRRTRVRQVEMEDVPVQSVAPRTRASRKKSTMPSEADFPSAPFPSQEAPMYTEAFGEDASYYEEYGENAIAQEGYDSQEAYDNGDPAFSWQSQEAFSTPEVPVWDNAQRPRLYTEEEGLDTSFDTPLNDVAYDMPYDDAPIAQEAWQEGLPFAEDAVPAMPEENVLAFDAAPRRRRSAVVPAAVTQAGIAPGASTNDVLAQPQRRLDQTPFTLPQKENNPLESKNLPEYRFPPIDLLDLPRKNANTNTREKDEKNAQKLADTLSSFGIQVKVLNVTHGPAITRYELQPAPGVKVSRIVNLVDDIALNMASAGVRIEAPIPGKPAVGIEIPNESISMVALREVLDSTDVKRNESPVACALGKDIAGKNVIADLAKMPHVLIAGATGSGKSVCINTLINSIIFRASPEEVRLILIDPKVVELSIYNGIPHLLIPVVTDPKKASGALSWAVVEMEKRYKRFADAGVRDIRGYNANLHDGEEAMPKIVVIIDELADLMMVAPGEVEDSICRLAQLARAAGIHLVIATQRPSVNVITGVIKANIPSRIAFAVSSQIDSRTILDGAGAEKLLGKGDMLYAPQGSTKPLRVQGCFVSDDEVTRVVEYVKQTGNAEYDEDVMEIVNSADVEALGGNEAAEHGNDGVDEYLQQAIEMVVESGQASISMLQRRLRVGYARAGRLIDEMTKRGIVSQAEGAKPRTVLITREEFRQMFEME